MLGTRNTSDRSVADWLDELFTTARPAGGAAEFTAEDVARAVTRDSGRALSARTITRLRSGELTNPTLQQIQALARFFRVSPVGCFGPDAERRLAADLTVLEALRGHRVATMAAELDR